MKTAEFLIFTVIALILTGSSGCISDYNERAVSKATYTYDYHSGMNMTVTNDHGDIDINAGETSIITLTAYKISNRGRDDLKGIKVVSNNTDGLSIYVHRPKGSSAVVHLELLVPTGLNIVSASTIVGSIGLNGTEGDTRINTTAGDIYLENLTGAAVAYTGEGDITILDSPKVASAETLKGYMYIRYTNITSGASFKTMNGSIDVIFYNALNLNFEADSGVGNISIHQLIIEPISKSNGYLTASVGVGGPLVSLTAPKGAVTIYGQDHT